MAHTGGYMPLEVHKKTIAQQKGTAPSLIDIFERTHRKKTNHGIAGQGDWVRKEAEDIYNKYQETIDSYILGSTTDSSSRDLAEFNAYLKATGGVKTNRIMGMPRFPAHLLIHNQSSRSSDGAFHSRTNSCSNPNRDNAILNLIQLLISSNEKITTNYELPAKIKEILHGSTTEELSSALAQLFHSSIHNHVGSLFLSVLRTVEQDLVELECHRWKSKDVNINYKVRDNRKGYKAGAIKEGMQYSYAMDCDYVAMFDADFQPESDFLMRTVPFLVHNLDIALVQTRWKFVNADECMMTRIQEMSLDYHFKIEQEAGHLHLPSLDLMGQRVFGEVQPSMKLEDGRTRQLLKTWI